MLESKVTVIDDQRKSRFGKVLVNIVRIPTNPLDPKDEKSIKELGFKVIKEYLKERLDFPFEVEPLNVPIVRFHIGNNYADLKGTYEIKPREKCT